MEMLQKLEIRDWRNNGHCGREKAKQTSGGNEELCEV